MRDTLFRPYTLIAHAPLAPHAPVKARRADLGANHVADDATGAVIDAAAQAAAIVSSKAAAVPNEYGVAGGGRLLGLGEGQRSRIGNRGR